MSSRTRPAGAAGREATFQEKAAALGAFSARAAAAAGVVAAGARHRKRLADQLHDSAHQVTTQGPAPLTVYLYLSSSS